MVCISCSLKCPGTPAPSVPHLMVSLYLSRSEAMYASRLRALEGRCVVSAQKALQGSETESRELLEERKTIVFPRQGVIDFYLFGPPNISVPGPPCGMDRQPFFLYFYHFLRPFLVLKKAHKPPICRAGHTQSEGCPSVSKRSIGLLAHKGTQTSNGLGIKKNNCPKLLGHCI